MSEITVRHAQNTDDFQKIAACIYHTDPFIYPAAFGPDIVQASRAISKLMHIPDSLFHPDHLLIAFREKELCGILMYNQAGATWDTNRFAHLVQDDVPDLTHFHYVSNMYFSVEAAPPPENHIELVACCVMPGFRNLGVGRALLNHLIAIYPDCTISLDVLTGNNSAIHLYQKCGFEISAAQKGFSMEESTRPDCYRMVRKPNHENHASEQT